MKYSNVGAVKIERMLRKAENKVLKAEAKVAKAEAKLEGARAKLEARNRIYKAALAEFESCRQEASL